MKGEFEMGGDVITALCEIEEALTKLSSEERIYRIVKWFHRIEEPDEGIQAKFWQWMFDSENQKEKELAMERVFAECVDETILKCVDDNVC